MKKVQELLIIVLSSLFIIFSGCEVGLGDAVDTEAPIVGITYPPESVAARGSLLVKGTCTDDQKINRVEVYLENSDNASIKTETVRATVDNETWFVTFDTTQLVDGAYTINAIAYDNANRNSLTGSRTFDIDNTPPVIILSKPLAVTGDTPSTYGRVLKIAGDISDQHIKPTAGSNEKIPLKFNYQRTDSNGTVVSDTIVIDNVTSMTADDPLIIAKYYDESDPTKDEKLFANYKAIYGDLTQVNGQFQNREIKCTIEMEDLAREYNGSENTSRGNITTRYYINSTDFYDQLMSDRTYGLTATNLYKIFNKTYTGTDSEQILTILNNPVNKFYVDSNALAQTGNTSVFKLNPDNNPVFLVGGFDVNNTTGQNYEKFNIGNSLLVTVECGKDEIYIDETSLQVKFTRLIDNQTKTLSNSDLNWQDGNGLTSVSNEINIYGEENPTLAPRDSNNQYFFKSGNCYLIEVTGTDENGVEIKPKDSKTFGFELSSKTSAPRTETETNGEFYNLTKLQNGLDIEVTLKEDNSHMFTGTYSVGNTEQNLTSEDYARITIPTVTVYKNGEAVNNILIEKKDVKIIQVTEQTGNDYYNYKLKLKIGYVQNSVECVAGDGKYKFSMEITITDIQNNRAYVNKQFYIDCNPPTITGFNDPVGTVVNGKFKISGTVKDNEEVVSVKYKIQSADAVSFQDMVNPEKEIISTNYADNIDLPIVITAEDGVGNITTKNLSYHINQSTDKPQITGSNFDVTIDNKDNVKYENNVAKNIFNSNEKLTGYISDDDGNLAETSITFYKKNTTTDAYDVPETISDQGTLPTENGKTFSNIKVPSNAGIYKVKIYAKDSKHETDYYEETKEFYIGIDNSAPTIKETTHSDAEFYSNGNITFNVELNDDWDKTVLINNFNTKVYKIVNGNEEDITSGLDDASKITKNIDSSTYKGTVTIDLTGADYEQGSYKVKFNLTDRAGKTATLVRSLQKETVPPSTPTAAFTPAATDSNGYYGGSELTLTGSSTDLSGIAKIQYKVGSGEWNTFSITPTEATDTSAPGATYSGLISNLANGTTITVKSTDKAGNESAEQTITAKIDTTAPAIANIKQGETTIIYTGENQNDTFRFNASTTKTFTFEATDLESGVDSITPSITGVTITPPAQGSTTYTLDIPAGVVTSTGNLYVTAKDKVGNEAEVKICSIKYDNDAPTVTFKSAKYYNTDNNLKAGTVNNTAVSYVDANGKITLSGTASDTELKKVWLEYSSDGISYAPYGDAITDVPQSWSFDVTTTDTSKFTDNTTYYFRVAGEDETGNPGYSDVKTININQDSDRPKINLTSTYYDSVNSKSWLKKTKELYLNVTDDDGDVQSVTITSDPTGATYSDGKITFTTDNTYTIKFEVTEKVIESGVAAKVYSSDGTIKPKLIGNDGNAYTTAELVITVDTTQPVIKDVKLGSKKNSTDTVQSDAFKDAKDVTIGGEYKFIDVQFKATDDNGIKSIKIQNENGIEVGTPNETVVSGTNIVKSIDISSAASGNHEYTIIAEDKAGMESKQKFNITVDNTPPVITTTAPDAEELEGIAFTIKGEVDGSDQGSKIKYIVDKDSNDIAVTDSKWSSNSAIDFTEGDTVTTWRLYVDGDVNNTGDTNIKETHSRSHKQLFVDVYSNVAEFNSNNVIVKKGQPELLYEDPEPVYFHFLALDKAENKGTCTLKLMIDPQGDIPTVKVDSPVVSEYLWYTTDENVEEGNKWKKDVQANTYNFEKTIQGNSYKYKGKGTTLSGSINVQGTADPKVGSITGVYMQIDPTYDPETGFDDDPWKNKATASAVRAAVLCPGGATVEEGVTPVPGTTLPSEYEIEEIKTGLWGVKVGTSTSWSKTINQNNLFVYSTGSNKIALRLYAKNSEGKVTTLNKLNDFIITVDSDAPVIAQQNPFYLYQFAWKSSTTGSVVYTNKAQVTTSDKAYSNPGCTAGESSITSVSNNQIRVGSTTYTKDFISKNFDEGKTWITGQWWLRFSVEDEQDVYQIKIANDTIVTKNNGIDNGTYVANNVDSNGKPKSTVERKIWSASNTKGFIVNYKVGSSAEDTSFGRNTYTISATDYKEDDGKRKTSTRELNVKYDNKVPTVSVSGEQYFNISDYIVNSNNSFDFSNAAFEDTQESGFDKVLYYFRKTSDSKIYKLSKSGNTNDTYSYTGDQDIYVDGNGTQISTIVGDVVTVSDGSSFDVNKLVRIGGSYYLIKSKASNVLTLDGKPSKDLEGSNAYPVIGNVVPSNKITTNGNRTVWEGTINSLYLDDGKVEINYIVFDKAGNYIHKTIDAIVGNNAPRIASVRVWCDKNRNNAQNEGEYKDYFYNEKTVGQNKYAGDAASILEVVGDTIVNYRSVKYGFPTSIGSNDSIPFMTVKDVFKITPEVVGGNGALYYSYVVADRNKCIDNYNSTKKEFVWDSNSVNIYENQTPIRDSGPTTKGYENYKLSGQDYVDSSKFDKLQNKITVDASSISNRKDITDNLITYFEFTIWDSTTGLNKFDNSLHAKIQLAMKVEYVDTQAPKSKIGKFGYNSSWDFTPDEHGKIYSEKYTVIEGTDANPVNVEYPYSHIYDMNLEKGHVELSEDWKALNSSNQKITSWNNGGVKAGSHLDSDPKVSGWITLRGVVSDNVYIDEINLTFPGIAPSGITVAQYDSTEYQFVSKKPDALSEANDIHFAIIDEVYDDDGHHIEWQCDINTEKVDDTKVKIDSDFVITAVAARGDDDIKNAADTYTMDVVPYIYDVETSVAKEFNRTALGHYPVSSTPTIKCFNGNPTFPVNEDTKSQQFTYSNGTIPSFNNINNPNAVYNQVQREQYNILSDDVYFDVWDINSNAALPHDDRILDAQMKINPINGMIGFAFCNGKGRWSMANGTSNGTPNSYQAFSRSPDFFQCTGFAYNSSGISFGVALGGESNSGYNLADDFNFFVSSKGCPGDDNYNNSRTSDKAFHIASMYQHNKKDGGTEEYYVKNRFASPSIATNGSNVYLAYYDRINKEIRFHGGTLNSNNDGFEPNNTFAKSEGIRDYQGNVSTNFTYAKSTNECQVVIPEGSGGEYVSLAATSNDTVIMVWYDESTKSLMYSYLASGSGNIKTGVNRTGWTEPENLTSDTDAGEYCQVVVDSEDHVHIACYDSKETALRYIYIPNCTAPTTNKSCLVDSYLDVGQYITIDVAQIKIQIAENQYKNYQIPHIGYWSSSPEKPVYAYIADYETFFDPNSTEEAQYSGVYGDKYTGIWEIAVVPTSSDVYQTEDSPLHMNVGVWKNAGVKSNSTPGTSSASTANGTCYGNGTSNAVMGYIIEDGTKTKIEIMQKRDSN